jgi:hypothetical protein
MVAGIPPIAHSAGHPIDERCGRAAEEIHRIGEQSEIEADAEQEERQRLLTR